MCIRDSFFRDLTRFLLGNVSFDARNINGSNPNSGAFGLVTIAGTSATASLDLAIGDQPEADGNWRSYIAPLDPDLWNGDLAMALENVVSISVVLESVIGITEFNGFDNFILSRNFRQSNFSSSSNVEALAIPGMVFEQVIQVNSSPPNASFVPANHHSDLHERSIFDCFSLACLLYTSPSPRD